MFKYILPLAYTHTALPFQNKSYISFILNKKFKEFIFQKKNTVKTFRGKSEFRSLNFHIFLT